MSQHLNLGVGLQKVFHLLWAYFMHF